MNENFDKIMGFILDAEGGYVNDKNDPGGETNMGISKRSFPKEDIKNMTEARAKELYRNTYWSQCGADVLPWPLDLYVMNLAVTSGAGTSRKVAMRSKDGEDFLLNQIAYYHAVVIKHPVLKKYSFGWTERVLQAREAGKLP